MRKIESIAIEKMQKIHSEIYNLLTKDILNTLPKDINHASMTGYGEIKSRLIELDKITKDLINHD